MGWLKGDVIGCKCPHHLGVQVQSPGPPTRGARCMWRQGLIVSWSEWRPGLGWQEDLWVRGEASWGVVLPQQLSEPASPLWAQVGILSNANGSVSPAFLQVRRKRALDRLCTDAVKPTAMSRLCERLPASLVIKHLSVDEVLCLCGRMSRNPPFLQVDRGPPAWPHHGLDLASCNWCRLQLSWREFLPLKMNDEILELFKLYRWKEQLGGNGE